MTIARPLLLSSPRRRGPITTALSVAHKPCNIGSTRRVGPRLRGDDSNIGFYSLFAIHHSLYLHHHIHDPLRHHDHLAGWLALERALHRLERQHGGLYHGV